MRVFVYRIYCRDMEKMTTAEYIVSLLTSTDRDKWGDTIVKMALGWNEQAYKLESEVVESMCYSLMETYYDYPDLKSLYNDYVNCPLIWQKKI